MSTSKLLSIFVSYAHEDEPFKDRLLSHLASLKRKNLLNTWDDREIDGGNDWRADIDHAMTNCNLALLLVSNAFLASEFIQSYELNALLERERRDEIKIVPIIVKPCTWRMDSIGELQPLPKDGKPIITFPEVNGERDDAWVTIANKIAGWANDFIAKQNLLLATLQEAEPQSLASSATISNSTNHPKAGNPFNPWQSPTAARFLGRDDLLISFQDALNQGRSISLIGDWRIGKTSLLNAWKAKVENMGRVVRLLSGQGPAAVSCEAFIRTIANINIEKDDPDIAADALTRWAEQSREKPPLVLIDEADAVLHRLPIRFFARWRDLIEHRKICFVLASRLDISQILNQSGEPIPFNGLLQSKFIGLLKPEAAERIISLGTPPFNDTHCILMRRWAGQHPYFLTLFGHYLWHSCQYGGDIADALDDFNDQAAARLVEIWGTLAENEKVALYMLLDGQSVFNSSLKRRGLIVIENQRPRIFGEVLAAWLASQR